MTVLNQIVPAISIGLAVQHGQVIYQIVKVKYGLQNTTWGVAGSITRTQVIAIVTAGLGVLQIRWKTAINSSLYINLQFNCD